MSHTADISLPAFPLGDDESSPFSRLSMESDADDLRAAESEHEEGVSEPAFPSYLSCRGCSQLLEDPLGPGVDLVGPYCTRCCKESLNGVADRKLCASFPAEVSAGGDDGSLKLNSCTLCGFTSRYTNHVKRHMKTHNGEKPYGCPLCSYASAQLVNLQRHLRIHTGEKPYKCNHCTFACSSLGNLKRHQRMHTAVSQVVCHPASGNGLNRTAAEKEVVSGPTEGKLTFALTPRKKNRFTTNVLQSQMQYSPTHVPTWQGTEATCRRLTPSGWRSSRAQGCCSQVRVLRNLPPYRPSSSPSPAGSVARPWMTRTEPKSVPSAPWRC